MTIPRKSYKILDKALKVWYNDLNKKLFRDSLPRNIPIYSFSSRKFYGLFAYGCDAKGKAFPEWIRINADAPIPITILVHEMVHVWQRCVKQKESKVMHDREFATKLRWCYDKLGLPKPSRLELSN